MSGDVYGEIGDKRGDRLSKSGGNTQIPEGVYVLTGTIFAAYNLPPNAVDEEDGRVFFRVLHVDGGGNSSMFKCKTTIFKSDVADDLRSPVWCVRSTNNNFFNGTFRFEMYIPEGYTSSSDGTIEGEILISLYRTRAAGGNDFIGQVGNVHQILIL